jgi:hypothetical protein
VRAAGIYMGIYWGTSNIHGISNFQLETNKGLQTVTNRMVRL